MKALKFAVACVVVVGLMASAASASVTYAWENLPDFRGEYFLPSAPDEVIKIQEDVYQWTVDGTFADVWGETWTPGIYLYRYTVTNLGLSGAVDAWGFTETFQEPGIVAILEPPSLDTAKNWSHAGDGTATPIWWTADTAADGFLTALDSFGIVAWGEPHALFDAKAVTSTGAIAESPDKISGPTPEPCSAFLLVSSGVGLYGLLRRRRE